MIKIYIIADSYKHFDTSIKEYEKRLWKSIELVKLKPIKNWTNIQIIEKETDLLIKKIEKENSFKIVLNPKWRNLDTKEFSKLIESKQQTVWNISFIIGWAFWFSYDKLKPHISYELNFWTMTMPHSLALLVLLEQVYRIGMIKKWTSYHK